MNAGEQKLWTADGFLKALRNGTWCSEIKLLKRQSKLSWNKLMVKAKNMTSFRSETDKLIELSKCILCPIK